MNSEVWPRSLVEQLIDLKLRKWRYPVEPSQLCGRIA